MSKISKVALRNTPSRNGSWCITLSQHGTVSSHAHAYCSWYELLEFPTPLIFIKENWKSSTWFGRRRFKKSPMPAVDCADITSQEGTMHNARYSDRMVAKVLIRRLALGSRLHRSALKMADSKGTSEFNLECFLD